MLYTINQGKVQEILIEALQNSSEINQFCQEYYGKNLLISGFYDARKPITEEDCPAFVLIPDGKEEGQELENYDYRFLGALQVLPKVEENGIQEINDLVQLIYSTLHYAKEDRPVAEFSVEWNHSGLYPMQMAGLGISYKITPILGVPLEF